MKLNTQRIREKLQERDRNVSWLARQIDISPQTLSAQLENQTVKDADKIAKALGVGFTTIIIKEA